jgi:hypothetical protein
MPYSKATKHKAGGRKSSGEPFRLAFVQDSFLNSVFSHSNFDQIQKYDTTIFLPFDACILARFACCDNRL